MRTNVHSVSLGKNKDTFYYSLSVMLNTIISRFLCCPLEQDADDFPIVEVLPVLEKAIKSPLYRNTVSLLLGILSGGELGIITVLHDQARQQIFSGQSTH